jgi:hypothetical protein
MKEEVIVATHDSDEETKRKAKFVCKGEDDQKTIQKALDSL